MSVLKSLPTPFATNTQPNLPTMQPREGFYILGLLEKDFYLRCNKRLSTSLQEALALKLKPGVPYWLNEGRKKKEIVQHFPDKEIHQRAFRKWLKGFSR